MLWIYLIILIVLFFGGLLFFLQYILTRRIRKTTDQLHELSRDITAKQKEANELLENAQKEAKGIVAKETQAGQEEKNQLIKEGNDQKEQILKEAHQKSAEIAEKAQKNADFLRKEIDSKIDERAKVIVNELIQKVIPDDVLSEVHQRWLGETGEGAIDFKHLKLPEDVKEGMVTSAFPLTADQKTNLEKRIKKRIGSDIKLKMETDKALLAGFVIKIGSVVVDASLRYKIQVAMRV